MDINYIFSSSQISEEILELAETYENFAVSRIIGYSHDNRPITMLRIGLGLDTVVMVSGFYGYDTENPLLMLQMAKEYCEKYQNHETKDGYSIYELLNRCSICMIPLLNPDGYEISIRGFDAIENPILRQLCKMKEMDAPVWPYNARGVNLNENFPCRCQKSWLPGEYPASESETKALIRVFEQYDTKSYLEVQARGRVTCYLNKKKPVPGNHMHHLNRYFQKISGYQAFRKENEYLKKAGSGSAVHYYCELLHKPAVVLESIGEQSRFAPDSFRNKGMLQDLCRLPIEIMNKT